MITQSKSLAVEKIISMPEDRVSKVLIFMAGMEAEHSIDERKEINQPRKPPEQPAWSS